ncbi:MAG TPA: response regulator, partial [Terriglobia bacterium]|nr:response regulator [Terriglobia bacterium]
MEAARILVVDDDELTLTVLRKMLEADGYEVDTCSTASEALARCLHASYDLILCDMWMSGLSGKDFYLKIKQGFPEYQRRIVFITGDIASEATWGFIDERRLPYVLKPISRPLLRRKMQEILGAPQESAAGEAGKLPWNGEERRNQPRIAVADTALVRPGDGMPAEDETAVVVNASPAAIYFLSDRDYRVGMRTAVKYPHQGSAGAEREGLVVRVDLHPDGRRGVAVALRGEPGSAAAPGAAPLARAASAALPPEVVAASLARLGLDEEEQARRREEELEELRRVHDQVLDQRDRLAAEEAELRKKLAE